MADPGQEQAVELIVTQADREMAVEHLRDIGAATAETIQGTLEGRYHEGLVQGFARCRIKYTRPPPQGEQEARELLADELAKWRETTSPAAERFTRALSPAVPTNVALRAIQRASALSTPAIGEEVKEALQLAALLEYHAANFITNPRSAQVVRRAAANLRALSPSADEPHCDCGGVRTFTPCEPGCARRRAEEPS